MAEFETKYQALAGYEDEDTDNDVHVSEADVMIHVVPERSKARWNHIENLDDFFTRVYHYHQRHGIACMVVEDVLQLIQFVFVVIFSTFLLECVNYDVLFANIYHNVSHKVTIPEAIVPVGQCVEGVVPGGCASVLWLFRTHESTVPCDEYIEIWSFYNTALRPAFTELRVEWHEVQRQLLEVQMEQQMCIHKQNLTELDIYHRILRFKNYMIAMVNKSLLPLKFKLPFVGDCAFMSTGLKYNMELILFWGPWSPFENNWHLKDEYKNMHKRDELAQLLSQRILWIGLANFALSPLIFLWQILYSFFRYADIIKRHPGMLGARRWSNYGRIYLRHFNELDHEFNGRLNRGYKSANLYMNIFISPLLVILAKNIAFFAGAVGAVLVILTVVDEDVLSVEHVLTTMTVAGVIVTVCHGLIPDEHTVYCPESLMRNILANIHYIPDKWKGNCHTLKVRNEFALLFQYKIVYLLEELFSPLLTPFILCFGMRKKSLEIVNFFRNFTVDVVGVGDVCSFAQMDIRKHGTPQWADEVEPETCHFEQKEIAEDGKIELSLMHFHLTNPEWKPPEDCSMFINNLKGHAQRDLSSLGGLPVDPTGLISSEFHSLSPGFAPQMGQGLGYNSLVSSITNQSMMPSGQYLTTQPYMSSSGLNQMSHVRGAVSHCEGPLGGSMNSSGSLQGSLVVSLR
ncbi:hypothetical protein ScPMuIL_015052 [Solemya velum]